MRLHRLAAFIVIAWALAGCAFTFGEGPPPDDATREEQVRRRMQLYRQEQERLDPWRQGFGGPGGPYGSER